eukprot:CAMPEP_0197309156 /NCGR_PEP_ID=MMETSP0891-20130614/7709_1 /TAXON_ID=44058 ORGANISM="Aureoumbra lagunensis, Strain CCMP1510" /NCGR_SAMPLE_ID=MMETSP0891 /ASSEMBLY_ACC=CAM_ASM_000534 /LENGTH=382 /DNA_ID=CAMNT_0042794059 /DNA_START=35 /DNA_END=1184 /DNA_ORIENTATION=-
MVVEEGEISRKREREENDEGSMPMQSKKRTAFEYKGGGRTGGLYVPPFKMAAIRQEILSSKNSREYQKLKWEELRKGINGLINKVNSSNIREIVVSLFELNLVRGRGLLARALMKAQLASAGFTHIYAAVVAVINTKLPENGELILKRLVFGFRRAYKRRDKLVATAFAKFLAHLVNHQVAHEIIALQLLAVLLEEPTEDSVLIAVDFCKEVGSILMQLAPQGLIAVFDRFRAILHDGEIDKRVQYAIENLFSIRKDKFAHYPAVPEECDVVDREEQITFELGLDESIDKQEMLDIFQFDPDFDAHETAWKQIKIQILGEDSDDEDSSHDNEANPHNAIDLDTTTPAGELTANAAEFSALTKNTTIQDFTEQELFIYDELFI